MWIIKTFGGIYLQDNHHFKDLNIQKRGLIFRIQIKNASKCKSQLKKTSKKESKVDQNSNMSPAPKMSIQHSWSANWHKLKVWPKDYWIEINLTLFVFLEIRTRPNLYLITQLIFQSNRGCLSKFSILFDLPLSSSFLLIFQIPLR